MTVDRSEFEERCEAMLRDESTALSPPARCAALTALLDLRGRVAASKSSQDGSSGPVEAGSCVALATVVPRSTAYLTTPTTAEVVPS